MVPLDERLSLKACRKGVCQEDRGLFGGSDNVFEDDYSTGRVIPSIAWITRCVGSNVVLCAIHVLCWSLQQVGPLLQSRLTAVGTSLPSWTKSAMLIQLSRIKDESETAVGRDGGRFKPI